MFLELKKEQIEVFDQIYREFWSDLYQYAFNIIRNKEISEEIVQEAFLVLWSKTHELHLINSIQAYLYATVKFKTLTYIRALKVRTNYAASFSAFAGDLNDNSNEENICLADLKKHLELATNKLPEKCQLIFRMSRHEYQSIKDISNVLNLSHKTVENQLSKALKHLRSSLSHFLLFSVTVIISF